MTLGESHEHWPTCSIILPTYNRCDIVEQTLLRFLAQDYPADFEILVADNSTDGTPAMVERLAETSPVPLRLLWSEERLPAVKRNDALHAATGDLVFFMNDDVWVRPDFLIEHARTHLASDEPIGVLGLVDQSEQMPPLPFTQWYRPFGYHRIADRADQEVDWRFFWTMNISLPRQEMLDRNLVFHEDWAHIGCEDMELGYRWEKAGLKLVYNPRAWGEHYHPHDLDSACRLQASIGRGMRDMEVLVPEPGLHEWYGILHPDAKGKARLRMRVRGLLFNRYTVPPLQRYFAKPEHHSRLAEWTYWKIMLHHTQSAYEREPRRSPQPVPIRDPQGAAR